MESDKVTFGSDVYFTNAFKGHWAITDPALGEKVQVLSTLAKQLAMGIYQHVPVGPDQLSAIQGTRTAFLLSVDAILTGDVIN